VNTVVRLADLEGRRPRVDTHPLEVHQRGEVLQLNAERAVPVAEGSYRWSGELRPWDNVALIGSAALRHSKETTEPR
jgi:hypothetical protein